MNINFKWGFYIDNKLVCVDAQLNTDIEYYKKLKQVFRIETLQNASLTRLNTAKYYDSFIMADNFKKSRVAYSFGVDSNFAWDIVMHDKGYEVFKYNSVVEQTIVTPNGFTFNKGCLAKYNDTDTCKGTLENYIKQNSHTNKTNMVLRIDIEGAEWDFLESVQTKTLRQFDQIIIEYHNLVRACNEEEMNRRIALLHKINATHQAVHLHANNTAYVLQMQGATLPDVLEVTYVNRDSYKTLQNKSLTLPTELDLPKDPNREDILLGLWNKPITDDLFEIEF